jgi:hypothetical protein
MSNTGRYPTRNLSHAPMPATVARLPGEGAQRAPVVPPIRHVTRTAMKINRDRMERVHFIPHRSPASVRTLYRDPQVVFSRMAIDKIGAYVGLMDKEIAWMSSVRRLENDVYYIDDCYLFGQAVHATTAEIDAELLGRMATEIIMSRPEDGVEIVNSLRCWGHSHVDMGTTPSGQDETQMEDFADMVTDFMIRLIANKKGDIRVDLFDYESGLVYERMPWACIQPSDSDLYDIAAEIEEKVEVMGYGSYSGGSYPGGYKGGRGAGSAYSALMEDETDEDDSFMHVQGPVGTFTEEDEDEIRRGFI